MTRPARSRRRVDRDDADLLNEAFDSAFDENPQRKDRAAMLRPSATLLGVLIGIALGFAGAFGGFDAFIIVAVLILVGVLVGRVVDGELDLTDYLGGRGRRDR